MNTNNFWGMSRSTGMNVGLIVRVGLVTLSLVGSLMLAWTLLSPHQGAHASPAKKNRYQHTIANYNYYQHTIANYNTYQHTNTNRHTAA